MGLAFFAWCEKISRLIKAGYFYGSTGNHGCAAYLRIRNSSVGLSGSGSDSDGRGQADGEYHGLSAHDEYHAVWDVQCADGCGVGSSHTLRAGDHTLGTGFPHRDGSRSACS